MMVIVREIFIFILILPIWLSAFTVEQTILQLHVGFFKDSTVILSPKSKFNECETPEKFNLANVDCSKRFAQFYHLREMHSKIEGKSFTLKDRLANNGIFIIKKDDQKTLRVKKSMGESWKVFVEGSKDVQDRSNVYNAQGGIEVHW